MNRRAFVTCLGGIAVMPVAGLAKPDRIVTKAGERAARHARVWLNGIEVTSICWYADSDGLVVLSERTETGGPRITGEPRQIAMHRVRGDVVVKLNQPDGPELSDTQRLSLKAETWKRVLAAGLVEPQITAVLCRGIL